MISYKKNLIIQKFKLALDEFEIRNEKLKPNLSDDWISGLKTIIKNYRNQFAIFKGFYMNIKKLVMFIG